MSDLSTADLSTSDIAIRGVHKSYGKTAVVHGVDIAISGGEFVVILGPSGCGKSTLLRMIAGLEDISAGDIAIGGRIVNQLEPRERGCAMVFQNYALYPHMSVGENIGYALKVAGVSKPERQKRIESVAQMLALTDYLSRKPGQLSGGQRQRVAMGRAMIREPKVFLYDEPLSNLDAKLRVQMRAEIRKLHLRLGATSVFVTHDQVEAMTLADRIVVMNKGTVEQIGTPREIYHTPASTYVAAFIGTPGMTILDGVIETANACIRFSNGQALPVDLSDYPALHDGPVKLGIRAENITLGRGLDVDFDFAEEMGAAQLVHASFAGQTLVAYVRDSRVFVQGEPLQFEIRAADVHLFDAKSGRRIEVVTKTV